MLRAQGGVFLAKYLAEADSGLHASVAAATSAFEAFEGSGFVAAAVVSSPVCLMNAFTNLSKPWTFNYLYNVAVSQDLACAADAALELSQLFSSSSASCSASLCCSLAALRSISTAQNHRQCQHSGALHALQIQCATRPVSQPHSARKPAPL